MKMKDCTRIEWLVILLQACEEKKREDHLHGVQDATDSRKNGMEEVCDG